MSELVADLARGIVLISAAVVIGFAIRTILRYSIDAGVLTHPCPAGSVLLSSGLACLSVSGFLQVLSDWREGFTWPLGFAAVGFTACALGLWISREHH